MARKRGSGFATDTATACELLVAGLLASNDDDVNQVMRTLERERQPGYCGMEPSDIERQLREALERLDWDVVSVEPKPSDHLGDVRVTLRGGGNVWIEVKAQTKKTERELVQADWIRDETDFLATLLHSDERLKNALSAPIVAALNCLPREVELSDAELLAADIALAQTATKKHAAHIADTGSLWDFIDSKSVLLINRSGIRHLGLANLRPVHAIRGGQPVNYTLDSGTSARATIKVSVGTHPGRGSTHITYYVDYRSGVIGRHELHYAALP